MTLRTCIVLVYKMLRLWIGFVGSTKFDLYVMDDGIVLKAKDNTGVQIIITQIR